MAPWTSTEQRQLVEAHRNAYPSQEELGAMFPRHNPNAVRHRAHKMGLRQTLRGSVQWLRIAHTHFAKREAEIRAFNQERYG